jgi:hypothetical protein
VAVFEVSTSNLSLEGRTGATATFQITANVPWNIVENISWLTTQPSSGSSSTEVEVEATESNYTGGVRTASLLVSGNDTSYSVIVKQDMHTGNHTVNGPEPRIYPNPARAMLRVDLGKWERACTVRIFDSKGSQLFNERFQNRSELSLDVEGYQSGFYLIEIRLPSKRFMNTFMIR